MSKKKKIESLDILYDLSAAISSASAVEKIYDLILDKAVEAMGVDKASIMKFDPEEKELRIVAARGMDKNIAKKIRVKSGEGISGKVFKESEPILLKDVSKSNATSKRSKYKSSSLISAPVVCLPLKMAGRPIGVINMTDKKNGKPFSKKDLTLLTAITNQAAAYMHLCDLAQRVREAEVAERELEIARHIQRTLIPENLPKFEGLDIAASCITADKIGGDYYDVLQVGRDRMVAVVADVSGHSVGAALLMSAFRIGLKASASPKKDPSELVRDLNHLLYEDLVAAEQFISMVCINYKGSTHKIEITNAGHCPVLIWNNGSKKFNEVVTNDTLLGIKDNIEFHEKSLTLKKGDLIVLYTDGITEIKNSRKQMFGIERLKNVISKNSKKSSDHIQKKITEEVMKFGSRVTDDITIVAIKVR
ncbi:SpoIIE family protein phosphatase [bacterium]|nr:SpoIIE family protein phosphatase [bacterium]